MPQVNIMPSIFGDKKVNKELPTQQKRKKYIKRKLHLIEGGRKWFDKGGLL